MMVESETLSDEDGIALFYALLVVVIVGGIIAVTFAAALTEQRQSAFELDFEDTVHVAEAGAEHALQQLKETPAFTNVDVDGASTCPDPDDDEFAWAACEAENTAFDVVQVGQGEAVALRSSGGNSNYVYGVGFVPTRAAHLAGAPESFVRVVKLQIGFTSAETPGLYAMLAGAKLSYSGGGSSEIGGGQGNVHTNDELEPPSSGNYTVSGEATYVGVCSGCTDTDQVDFNEVDTVVPINFGTAEEVYEDPLAKEYVTNGGEWYDYCSGIWKFRGDAESEPCADDAVAVAAPHEEIGFTGLNQTGPPPTDGAVYYFDLGESPNLQAGDRTMTIITDGEVDLKNHTYSRWTPAYPGLYIYAGTLVETQGSFKINTNNKNGTPGTVYSAQDIVHGGNPESYQVSWIAARNMTLGGGGNKLFYLNGNASTEAGGGGQPFKIGWQELRE